MNKQIINIPKGIRFISDWPEFQLPIIPTIINKSITGCGFTEYCIRNDQNIILCSPRRILLENKESQHFGEVFYVRNDIDPILNIDKDLTSVKLDQEKVSEDQRKDLAEKQLILQESVLGYYYSCNANHCPCKILVTYDSFRHVKEALSDKINNFYIIVDEFQSIFTDSRFKSDTEMEFLYQLDDLSKITYVSATPMLDKYLEMLKNFKNLPYIEFDWETEDPSRVFKPQIDVRPCQSILKPAKAIINSYLSGNFEKYSYLTSDGTYSEIESREVVIYVNSVKNICDIIKSCSLSLDNTNILCSNTLENQKKIRLAFGLKGKSFSDINPIGSVPRMGEPHKMFTICTRTVYLGADFYSTNARSVILSDANIECLAVDISLDLPQILGRQRLIENPWKNRAEMYFKALSKKNLMNQEDFDKIIQEKLKHTEDRLKIYEGTEPSLKHILAQDYKDRAKSLNYANDYISVNLHSGKTLVPIINNLVLVSDLRAFEIQQVDYKDRFSVFNTIMTATSSEIIMNSLTDTLSKFDMLSHFTDKMRFLCDLSLDEEDLQLILELVPLVYKNYLQILGKEKIKSLGYQKSKLEFEYERLKLNQAGKITLEMELIRTFEVGKKYGYKFIKSELEKLYSNCNISSTAKATDLEKYFNVKIVKVNDPDNPGKRINGYEILSLK